jgi:hypothetical protein
MGKVIWQPEAVKPEDMKADVPIGERLGSERLYDPNLPPIRPPTELDTVVRRRGRPRGKRTKNAPTPPQAVLSNVPAESKKAEVNWRDFVANALQLTGIVAITVGCGLIALWLALVVGGVALVVLGVATGLNHAE